MVGEYVEISVEPTTTRQPIPQMRLTLSLICHLHRSMLYKNWNYSVCGFYNKPFQFENKHNFVFLLSHPWALECAHMMHMCKNVSLYIYLIQKFNSCQHISHCVKHPVLLIFSGSDSMHVITPCLHRFRSGNILVFTYFPVLILS